MRLNNRILWLWLAAGWVAASAPLALGAQSPHNYEQWEKEIAAYERNDRTNPPPPKTPCSLQGPRPSGSGKRWRLIFQSSKSSIAALAGRRLLMRATLLRGSSFPANPEWFCCERAGMMMNRTNGQSYGWPF
jgi:hypothetical protein